MQNGSFGEGGSPLSVGKGSVKPFFDIGKIESLVGPCVWIAWKTQVDEPLLVDQELKLFDEKDVKGLPPFLSTWSKTSLKSPMHNYGREKDEAVWCMASQKILFLYLYGGP